MLSQETASQVLQWPDGHKIHRFWDISTPVFRARAMNVVDSKEGYVRMWIEEKGAYGYKWRTATGELLETKPKPVQLSPINIQLERRLLAARDRKTFSDFNTLLAMAGESTPLPFDYFVKRLDK